jgi:hypothetical protein
MMMVLLVIGEVEMNLEPQVEHVNIDQFYRMLKSMRNKLNRLAL